MSHGYRNYQEAEPLTGGWERTIHYGIATTDHLFAPVISDSQAKKMPITSYWSLNADGRVMKSERMQGHVFAAPMVTQVMDRRYSVDPRKEEPIRACSMDAAHMFLDSAHYRSEIVEEFLTKVRIEASCQPMWAAVIPLSSAWHRAPNQGGRSSTVPKKFGDKELSYITDLENYYPTETPKSPNENSVMENIPPTTPEKGYLAKPLKPTDSGNNQILQTEARVTPSGTKQWWRSPDFPGEDNGIDSEKEIKNMNGGKRGNSSPKVYGGEEKALQKVEGNSYELPKSNGGLTVPQPRFSVPTVPKKEGYFYPETIDSTEASRRYGKSTNMGEFNERRISSKEAAMKYNGALVP